MRTIGKSASFRRPHVRRHAAGTVNFDYYRTQAAALRGDARRNAATVRRMCAALLTLSLVLVVALVIAAAEPRTADVSEIQHARMAE